MVVSMPMNHVSVAEEALSLSPADRADLARLLIESLEGDRRTDAEIKAELAARLARLKSGEDPGLNFEEVFRSAS
jgi:putative addiction module component (TIGR02574 family)